jgi:nucleotide-binding universal stress UspA family protein
MDDALQEGNPLISLGHRSGSPIATKVLREGIMQIKNVLVPVDFSPLSTLAVNYGAALARKLRARLTLAHVVESPTALIYSFPIEAEKVEKQRYEQAQRMLPAMLSLEDQDDLDLHIVVKIGEIEEQLHSIIREQAADLVVMGTHGRRLIGRLFLGSVTQNMLRKVPVPILTVCHVLRPLDFKRILFATDLSASSKDGFRYALELARKVDSRLVVAHVMDERPVVTYETPEVAAASDAERRRAIEEAADRFAEFEVEAIRKGVKIETKLSEGIPASTLLKTAEKNDIDLIILTVERKGLIERAILGSTAEPIIREAHVPVLSIPVGAQLSTEEFNFNVTKA